VEIFDADRVVPTEKPPGQLKVKVRSLIVDPAILPRDDMIRVPL
jgi:hypothetical protein